MRISDWSSDVCSSDLRQGEQEGDGVVLPRIGVDDDGPAGTGLGHGGLRWHELPLAMPHRPLRRKRRAAGDQFRPAPPVYLDPHGAISRLGAAPLRAQKHHSKRTEETTSELQTLKRFSYAVSCINKKHKY